MTTHISKKPTNQERNVVSRRVNFLEIMKIAVANNKDHSPQIAPLTISEGKVKPRLW
jgi:hypothetical protein